MDKNTNFSDINSIAYNADIRDQLKTLHEMLGNEMTDIANGAAELTNRFSDQGEDLLKYMSKLTSQLSIFLINARNADTNLTEEERLDYERIKSLTNVIGNLQDKLNRVVKLLKSARDINTQVGEEGMELAELIMNAQQEFRYVRSGLNAYGFLSEDPKMANLYESQREANQQKNTDQV